MSDLRKINIGIFNILDRIQAYRAKWERHLERNDTDPISVGTASSKRTEEVQKTTASGLNNYFEFYIHYSVHRNIPWNDQQMQQCAVRFISLQVHSTCFGRYTRPSSGVQV